MRRWTCVLLLVALIPHAAAAAPAEGTLVAEGAVEFPPSTTLTTQPQAVFVDDVSGVGHWALTADMLRITEYTTRLAVVNGNAVVLDRQAATTTFGDATLEWQGSGVGWLGAYVPAGTGATLASEGPLVLTGAASADVGNTAPPESAPEAERAGFGPRIDGPALVAEASGALALAGDFELKLSGPTVRAADADGARTYATGREERGVERIERHLFIEVRGGTLEAGLRTGVVLATSAAHLTSSGTVRAAFRDGALETRGAEYAPTGGIAEIAGDWRIDAAPDALRASGVVMRIRGELAATTLGEAPTLLAPFAARTFLPWLAVGLVAAGAAGGALLLRRRPKEPDFTVDECVSLANQAAEDGHFDEALGWIRRAQKQAPTSARLWTEEGFFLSELGDVAGALEAYARASAAASDDGEPALLAARLLVATGDRDEAGARLLLAMERTPSLVFEVIEDPAFDELRRRPPIAAAVKKALRE